jgi:hypothetical protein
VICGFEVCVMKLYRPIWSTIWNRTDDSGWWLELNCRALWIGSDVNECCHDQIWSAMWTGNYVTGNNHDQFEVICELDQLIKDDVMT